MDSAASEKKLVRVTIFQQPYTVRASGEAGETEALAQAVDTLMNQIAARAQSSDATRVAVLASLHLADRVRQLERELDTVIGRAAKLEDRLTHILNDQK